MRKPQSWMILSAGALTALILTLCLTVGGAQILIAGTQKEAVEVPIIMYHHILKDESLWGDYVIGPGQLEGDLAYLKEQGYTAVLPRDLAAFAAGEGTLPEKPVVLTFDDGNKSTLVYALPLLQKYGMKAALAVIGIHSEHYSEIADKNVQYAHVTWDDIYQLAKSGVVEIANHTYNLHEQSTPRSGIRRNSGEDIKSYREALEGDIALNEQLLAGAMGATPTTFVYPFGFIDSDADEVLDKLGFTATLGVNERINTLIKGQPESAKKLGRYNRPSSVSTADFFGRILGESGPAA